MMARRESANARRAPVIGVALSTTRLAAVWTSATGSPETRQRAIDATGADGWVALRDALRDAVTDWRATYGDAACTIRVALVTPLVEVRTVSLPPVSDHDAQRLLARAAARHFLSANEPMVVGVSVPIDGDAGAVTRVAAATPQRLLRALRDAIAVGGGTLGDVMPALVTWSLGNATQRAAEGVLQVDDTRFELVRWQHGAPIAVRRFARPDDLDTLYNACAALDGAVTLMATNADRADISRALMERGVSVARAHGDAPVPHADDLGMLAAWRLATASWVAGAPALPLALSDDVRDTATRVVTSAGAARRRMLVAAGLLLVTAAGVYRVGVLRELRAVRAERAAMAPALDSLGLRARSNDPLAVDRAVREVARAVVPWSRVLATLGVVLPRDAHVLGVRAAGDTLELEGVARDAGGVFTALEQAGFTELSATAPMRRERSANGDVTERFTFRARAPHRRANTARPHVAEGRP
jgi:hypothetical protein